MASLAFTGTAIHDGAWQHVIKANGYGVEEIEIASRRPNSRIEERGFRVFSKGASINLLWLRVRTGSIEKPSVCGLLPMPATSTGGNEIFNEIMPILCAIARCESNACRQSFLIYKHAATKESLASILAAALNKKGLTLVLRDHQNQGLIHGCLTGRNKLISRKLAVAIGSTGVDGLLMESQRSFLAICKRRWRYRLAIHFALSPARELFNTLNDISAERVEI